LILHEHNRIKFNIKIISVFIIATNVFILILNKFEIDGILFILFVFFDLLIIIFYLVHIKLVNYFNDNKNQNLTIDNNILKNEEIIKENDLTAPLE